MKSMSMIEIEKDISNSFSIQFYENKKFDNASPQRLAYHRIMFMLSGEGTIKIDDQIFGLLPSSLLLIGKGQVMNFEQGASLSGYELSFGDCFWEKTPQSANNCKAVLFDNAAANQSLPLTQEHEQELKFLFQCILTESIKDDYINKLDAMAAYLKIIMIKTANVNASLVNALENYEHKLYGQFLTLIGQHYQHAHEVQEYANMLGISMRKLTDISKRCGGRGAKESINNHLIVEAKRSLQFSAKPIKEIAFGLNFSSPDQFSHFFKKNVQVSPKIYRAHFINMSS